MDYTWTVSTPASSPLNLLMSVVAVRHRVYFVVVVVVGFFLVHVGVELILEPHTGGGGGKTHPRYFRSSFCCFARWFDCGP